MATQRHGAHVRVIFNKCRFTYIILDGSVSPPSSAKKSDPTLTPAELTVVFDRLSHPDRLPQHYKQLKAENEQKRKEADAHAHKFNWNPFARCEHCVSHQQILSSFFIISGSRNLPSQPRRQLPPRLIHIAPAFSIVFPMQRTSPPPAARRCTYMQTRSPLPHSLCQQKPLQSRLPRPAQFIRQPLPAAYQSPAHQLRRPQSRL